MDTEKTLRILEAAQGDPARLALATVDLVLAERGETERAEVRSALLAAAIPHWFDEQILAALLDERLRGRSAELVASLRELRFVQAIPARGANAFCVHQTNRQTLRAWWLATDAETVRETSRRAAACFAAAGGEPHLQIEALYHRFAFEPDAAVDASWALADCWMKGGQTESRLALANVLDELAGTLPHGLARAYALLETAATRFERQELSRSLAQVEEALIEAENKGKDWVLTEAHSLRGNVRREQGQLDEAMADYRQAYVLAEGLSQREPGNPRWRRELAIFCYKVGGVWEVLGNLDQALSAYRESHDRWAALVTENPKDTDLLHGLAAAHSYLGAGCYAQGLFREALAEFQEYSKIMARLSATEPANGDWLWELGSAHSWIGNVLIELGDSDASLLAYQRYKEVLTKLVAREPDNSGWRRDLSVAHSQIGTCLYRSRAYADALLAYDSGRTLLEALVATDATNANWRRELALLRSNIGDVLREQGEYVAAQKDYDAARAITVALVATEPANTLWQNDLSLADNRIALLRLAQDDLPGAIAAFRIALERIRRLAETDKGRVTLQVSLAISQNNLADVLKRLPKGMAEARQLVRKSLDLLNRLVLHPGLSTEGMSALETAKRLANDLATQAADPSNGAGAPRSDP